MGRKSKCTTTMKSRSQTFSNWSQLDSIMGIVADRIKFQRFVGEGRWHQIQNDVDKCIVYSFISIVANHYYYEHFSAQVNTGTANALQWTAGWLMVRLTRLKQWVNWIAVHMSSDTLLRCTVLFWIGYENQSEVVTWKTGWLRQLLEHNLIPWMANCLMVKLTPVSSEAGCLPWGKRSTLFMEESWHFQNKWWWFIHT